MSIWGLWHEGWTAALVNHLWQSTAVVVIAWVLAAALRKNHARVRYWVWFAASVKFLLPFSLLIAAGEWLRSLVPVPAAQPVVASVMEQVTQPFGQAQLFDASSAPIAVHRASFWPMVLVTVWLCGALFLAIRFGLAWARMNTVKRRARPFALAADVPVLSSSAPIEPGIFGVFRPVLLLPKGIPERLSAEQMRAVVAHEMCHVRRRDNLTFAIHIVVETLFWFHPLVWWIGSRLIEEREHACDEAAVENGMSAEIFAEGLLRVCRYCVESKLICVSCVTGADLKRRVQSIMSSQRKKLSWSGKLAIGLLTSMLVMGSVALGVMRIPAYMQLLQVKGPQPTFEVATIKPSKPDESHGTFESPDGYYTATHVSLRDLIRGAYHTRRDDQLISLPDWAGKEYFDVRARAETSEIASMRTMGVWDRADQFSLMLQSLLAERFHLVVSTTTRELPVYALVVARNGPKLKEVSVSPELASAVRQPPPPPPLPPSRRSAPGVHLSTGPLPGVWQTGPHQVTATECRMSWFADWLSFDSELSDRAVVDRTGLSGNYNFVLKGIAINHPLRPGMAQAPPEEFTVSIFTALQQQLGLKLVSQKAPVEVLVVNHVEQPSPN